MMVCLFDNSHRPRTDPPSQSDGVLGAWRTLKSNCTRFRPQQHRVYLSVAIANNELHILELYPWFHSAPKKILGQVETRVHAALAMPPTSPRSAPSSKLSPLYVPVSPFSRAERCKPYPLALVPTLGCSRPLPPSLLLLASALSGNMIPGYVFVFK